MKKIHFLVFLIINLTLGQLMWASDSFSDIELLPNFSFGGGALFGNYISGGGFADFSIRIFNNRHFEIRNHILLRGVGFSDNVSGSFTLSEKLSFGKFTEHKFDSFFYGYMEGGVGFWGSSQNMNNDIIPWSFSFGAGSGTDIFLDARRSIFLEVGFLLTLLGADVIATKPEKQWLFGGILQIGWRNYF